MTWRLLLCVAAVIALVSAFWLLVVGGLEALIIAVGYFR